MLYCLNRLKYLICISVININISAFKCLKINLKCLRLGSIYIRNRESFFEYDEVVALIGA